MPLWPIFWVSFFGRAKSRVFSRVKSAVPLCIEFLITSTRQLINYDVINNESYLRLNFLRKSLGVTFFEKRKKSEVKLNLHAHRGLTV